MKKYITYFWDLALTSTAKSTYLTTFGAGINSFLGFVFTVIIARSLSPSDFGYLSVFFNLVMIFFVICDVGLSSSVLKFLPKLIREGNSQEMKKVIKLAFFITLLVSGLLVLSLLVFSSPLAVLIFSKRDLSFPFIITSFAVIGTSLSYLFVSILQGQQRFLQAVISECSILFTKTIFIIVLLLSGNLNLVTVLLALSVTSFAGFILGIFFVKPSFFTVKIDRHLAKVLFGFGAWVALARIANVISGKIDTLMLVHYVEPEMVGFYAAAQRMTLVFAVLINGISVVLSPKFASLKSASEARTFMKKSLLLVCGFSLPLITLLLIIAPQVTIWVYGSVYEPAINILRWLLISTFFFVVSSVPITVILYFLGRPKLFALVCFFQLALILLGNLLFIPLLGVVGPAITLAVAYGIVFLVSFVIVYRGLKEK